MIDTTTRITFRLSDADEANVAAISAAMTDGTMRPRVSLSDAIRAALRIAAASLTVATTATAGSI